MPIKTSLKFDTAQRGQGISQRQCDVVENLRAKAFALQKRFDLAEQTAILMDEMLRGDDESVGNAVDNTYEAMAFVRLQYQLFRILTVDIWACVLDTRKSAASVRSILKDLRKKEKMDAIRAYCTDRAAMTVQVEVYGDDEYPSGYFESEGDKVIQRSIDEKLASIDAQWSEIDNASNILDSVDAERLGWARHNTTAHFRASPTGLIALDDDPVDGQGKPIGSGKLKWDEPIHYLERVRSFVYNVFYIVTADSWSGGDALSRFYAQSFWDRFKNGRTDMEPPATF